MKSAYESEALLPIQTSIGTAESTADAMAATNALPTSRASYQGKPTSCRDAPGSVVAVAQSYEGIVAAIRERRQELKLSQLAVDEIAGLQTGYTGKIECGDKRLGAMSMPCILGALGLELAVVRTVPHEDRQRPWAA